MGVYLLFPFVFSPAGTGLLIQTSEGNGADFGGRLNDRGALGKRY